tara:strand:+ start:10713 stop:11192 length:480 start_codon:yes stop_codon:yes gene_type:complete
MDPGTIMTVAKIGSMAMSAIGSMQQGNSANAAAQYNAQVANNNAIAARQAAGEDERRMRRLTKQRMGSLRAGGASLDLLEDSAMQEELEALSIRHGGEIQAMGFENTANLERAKGKAAKTSGFSGAAGSLLKGSVGLSLGSSGVNAAQKNYAGWANASN